MDVAKVQLWQGIWSVIAIVWGMFAPAIIEVLHPKAEGIKKMLLVFLYCIVSAVVVVGSKTGFQVNWQAFSDVMVLWTMLMGETKATWELFWQKSFNGK